MFYSVLQTLKFSLLYQNHFTIVNNICQRIPIIHHRSRLLFYTKLLFSLLCNNRPHCKAKNIPFHTCLPQYTFLLINHLITHNLLHTTSDIIHSPNPCHLILHLQSFRHSLPFFHLLHQSVHHLITFLVNLMHTLFALEDIYGLKIKNVEGQPHLFLDASISAPGSSADEMLRAWMEQADKLENDEISKEEYDKWRYKYPELYTYQKRVKVPSLKLSNYFVQELSKKK